MRKEIVTFLKGVCQHYHLNSMYFPNKDVWYVHKKGRAIMSFTTSDFYQLPKNVRFKMFEPLLKVGLSRNLGEKYKDQLFVNYHQGKIIA